MSRPQSIWIPDSNFIFIGYVHQGFQFTNPSWKTSVLPWAPKRFWDLNEFSHALPGRLASADVAIWSVGMASAYAAYEHADRLLGNLKRSVKSISFVARTDKRLQSFLGIIVLLSIKCSQRPDESWFLYLCGEESIWTIISNHFFKFIPLLFEIQCWP